MTIEIEYQLSPDHEPRVSETFYRESSAQAFINKVLAKFPEAKILKSTDELIATR